MEDRVSVAVLERTPIWVCTGVGYGQAASPGVRQVHEPETENGHE